MLCDASHYIRCGYETGWFKMFHNWFDYLEIYCGALKSKNVQLWVGGTGHTTKIPMGKHPPPATSNPRAGWGVIFIIFSFIQKSTILEEVKALLEGAFVAFPDYRAGREFILYHFQQPYTSCWGMSFFFIFSYIHKFSIFEGNRAFWRQWPLF